MIPEDEIEEIFHKANIFYEEHNYEYVKNVFIQGYQLAAQQIERLKSENEGHKEIARARGEAINELQEQYSIMDGRRERAIKSLEESEKQFGELQEAYNKLMEG